MRLPKPHNPRIFLVILSLATGITVYIMLHSGIPHALTTLFYKPPKTVPGVRTKPTPAAWHPPTAINIPKIDKNLPIKSASVSGNTWDMYDDAVAWLSTSAVPGQGNVILYAHDWTNLWVDLYRLKPGDTIEVEQNKTWKTYEVTGSRAVGPKDIQSILSDENRLTLYTCEGTFDEKRRVVYARPVSAKAPQSLSEGL